MSLCQLGWCGHACVNEWVHGQQSPGHISVCWGVSHVTVEEIITAVQSGGSWQVCFGFPVLYYTVRYQSQIHPDHLLHGPVELCSVICGQTSRSDNSYKAYLRSGGLWAELLQHGVTSFRWPDVVEAVRAESGFPENQGIWNQLELMTAHISLLVFCGDRLLVLASPVLMCHDLVLALSSSSPSLDCGFLVIPLGITRNGVNDGPSYSSGTFSDQSTIKTIKAGRKMQLPHSVYTRGLSVTF